MNPQIPDVGIIAPDFQTINSDKKEFRLKSRLGEGKHLMLIFYRGHW